MTATSAAVRDEIAEQTSGWDRPDPFRTLDDPLADCLVVVGRLHGKPLSGDAIRAGLPLVDARLTPALFPRAAHRAGLAARLVRRPLRRISNLVLPAVLLLKDQGACVLIELDTRAGVARVIQPESDLGERELPLAQLKALYSGYAFFISPEHRLDDRTRGLHEPGRGHWFWGAIRRSWRIYRDVAIASLVINLLALAGPFFILNVYDRVVPNQALETLWVLVAGMLVVYGFELLSRGLRAYFIDIAGKQTDLALSASISEKVLGLPMSEKARSVGSFANQISEFERLRDFITSATLTTVVDLPFMVLFIVVLHLIAPPLVWIPVAGIVAVAIYSVLIQGIIRRSVEHIFQASAQRHATVVESLTGLETIKAFGAEGAQQRRMERLAEFLATQGIRTRMISSSASLLAGTVQHLVWLGVAVSGVYLVMDGDLSLGGLIACLILASRAVAPVTQLVGLATRFNQARAAMQGLNRLMEKPSERRTDQPYTQIEAVRGELEFEDVRFAYPNQQVESIHGVSFRVGAGERVGIVGRCGSGKTTLLKLMLGLYQPTGGSVRLDGIDIRQLDPAVLRRAVGYSAQDLMLFYGSVRENIALGAPFVDLERIRWAAEAAGVTEFTDRHPLGLDMAVGERGELLSGGQRQAVSLARALLLDPPVLLLDEPTSAMDNASEVHLKNRIRELPGTKTLIVVTHRASLLDLVDRLLVIDQGRLIADGSREQIVNDLRQGRLIPDRAAAENRP